MKWLEGKDRIIAHIGHSELYMVLNHTIVLKIKNNGIVKWLCKELVSASSPDLSKCSWVSYRLKMRVWDLNNIVSWHFDCCWVYVVSS